MQYVIVGAGSLGQSFAALLAGAGQHVTLLATPRSAARLRAAGAIRLCGAVETRVPVGTSGVAVTSDPSDVPDGAAALFTTKGNDLAGAIESVHFAAGGRLAWAGGVQNGLLKDDLLVSAFGADRTVGAVTIFGAQRQPDESVTVGSLGMTYFGELDGHVSERVQKASDTFQAAGIPSQAHANIRSVLWSKACNATGVFGVTCLARASNQRLLSNAHLMRAYMALVRETAAVAAAYGVQVGDYPSFPPIGTYVEHDDQTTIDQLQPHSESGLASYASMTHDVLAGLPLEVDAVFGDIVQRGERKGISVPCLRLARDLLRGVDPGQA